MVDRPGFEPGQAEPKSAVLPLHHRSIVFQIRCKSNKKMKPGKFLHITVHRFVPDAFVAPINRAPALLPS